MEQPSSQNENPNNAFHPYGAQGAPRVNADVRQKEADDRELDPRQRGHCPKQNGAGEKERGHERKDGEMWSVPSGDRRIREDMPEVWRQEQEETRMPTIWHRRSLPVHRHHVGNQ